MEKGVLKVLVLTPEKIVYRGNAESVILPGERGVFEVLPHHKKLLSRLLGGQVVIDQKAFRIRRGIAKIGMNEVTLIVEEK